MNNKTWVYWVGLIIVAFAITGLIGGAFSIITPMTRLPFKRCAVGAMPIGYLILHRVAIRFIGSAIFLITGVYMMIKGNIQIQSVKK